MSANAEALPAAAAPATETANPWLIAVVVALAVFMEVLDTTIANVALPYIAGGLGVSQDEACWVVTTYLVANAISIRQDFDRSCGFEGLVIESCRDRLPGRYQERRHGKNSHEKSKREHDGEFPRHN